MTKILKSIVVLAAVTLCMILLVGHYISPTAKAQIKQAEKIENPQQDVCVLVEAFVVEVELAELYKQGVSPIGRKPDSVSVENIHKCLDAENLKQVTTGLKVAVRSGQRGEARITETVYVKRQMVSIPNDKKVPGNVRYGNYDIGKTLRVVASVGPTDAIFISFDFSESTYQNVNSTDEAPPDSVNREWSGVINLQPGRPAIVGAAQNQETGVFLILVADIKNK